jgi:glycosyltransferase involved in cell wall biosynthesis
MPVLNEAGSLARAFEAIDSQTYPRELLEILVVDGGSSDGTVEIVAERIKSDPRIRLLGGHGVNTPLAMNLGIDASTGDLIAKVDGHGWMNERFIELAAQALADDARVGCIGGRIQPIAESNVERANAYARFSRLGVGGGAYTAPNRLHEADTVQCGVYRRSALRDVGTFDPALAYGEDEELNYRLGQAGWKVILQPAMVFSYRVRPSLGALFRQYFRYGRARVAVVRKHPAFLRPKHTAPGLLVACLGLSVPATALPKLRLGAAAVWGGYLAIIAAGALWLSIRHRFNRPDLIASALLALHGGYGLGSLAGLLKLVHTPNRSSADSGDQSAKCLSSSGMQHDGMTDQSKPQQQDGKDRAG